MNGTSRSQPSSQSTWQCSILVVDDDPVILGMLNALLQQDFEVLPAACAEQARHLFENRPIDIILADQQLPGESGVQLLEWVRMRSPSTVRMLMTAGARVEDLVDAINNGQVYRYIFKPWRNDNLLEILRDAARRFLLERSHEQLLEELRRLNVELEERVQIRTRQLQEANTQLQDVNRQLHQRNTMLQKMAITDPLTGLLNRRGMERLARHELDRRAKGPRPAPITLGMIDADHFKQINSRYLLSGGDHVLAWLAQTLQQSIRTVDTVGRVGGEEFMLIAPETGPEGARVLGDRIRKMVETSSTVYNSEEIHITVSLGLVVADEKLLVNYDELRLIADQALQQAKQEGRNRSVLRVLSTDDPSPRPPPRAMATPTVYPPSNSTGANGQHLSSPLD